MDGAVVPTGGAQGFDVGGAALAGGAGELVGVGAQGGLVGRETDLAPVALGELGDVAGVVLGKALFDGGDTEILPVSLRSVEAVVGARDDGGQEFALEATERRLAEHRGLVEPHRGLERARVRGHQADDAEDAAGALDRGVEHALQRTGRLVVLDESDVGHA